MDQETNGITLKLFDEIQKTIKVLGAKKFVEILKFHRSNKTSISDENILEAENIIKVVCNEFEISQEDFFYPSCQTNNLIFAIGICAFLMEKNLKFYNKDVALILKKHAPQISVYKKRISLLNPKNATEKEVLEKLETIKTTLKNTQNDNRN